MGASSSGARFSRFIFPLHGLCLSCDAPGIRAAGGKRRQVDKCIQHVRQQFASNQVCRACCFGHCPPDPYDKGGLRVWGPFAWLTCTCGPLNLFASLTPHLATAAGIQCKPLSPCGWCALRHPWLACLPSFAIKDIRVSASSARTVVQDCTEAEDNTDARDKFFMYAAAARSCLLFWRSC